jgi:long-chain-fatty-acid--CoA ligase ACSBG
MSESSGPQTFSNPRNYDQFDHEMMASCGEKMVGTDMMIYEPDKEGNGEICYKGRNRFMGYYKNESDTQNTIDSQGYLHSGDVGKIDKRGNLTITGRIKELIITAGGENVAPVLIENELKEEIPFISNAMVIGDKRKYLVVLFTLKYVVDSEGKLTTTPSEQCLKFLKENIGSSAKNYEEISQDEKVIAFIDEGVKKANEKAISRAQHIRKWALIPGDFTVEGGELTPTLKLRRKVTVAKYTDVVEKLYQDPKL